MAKTPWEMADVGREYSHQTALFAWAAMCRAMGMEAANDPKSYSVPGYALRTYPMRGDLWPEFKWLHAIKNAEKGGAVRGAMSAAEGVRSGVFDVFLPVPRTFYLTHKQPLPFQCEALEAVYPAVQLAGLYLELKRPGKHHTSEHQLAFQADMRAAGYAAEIVVGWEAARDCLLTYLGKAPQS